MDLGHVGVTQFIYMGSMAFIGIVVPLVIALIWKFKKKERFTTILIGAATFMLFAILIEKPLQALVISLDHPVKRFLDATPVAWAFVVGLFRAYLKKREDLLHIKPYFSKEKIKKPEYHTESATEDLKSCIFSVQLLSPILYMVL